MKKESTRRAADKNRFQNYLISVDTEESVFYYEKEVRVPVR